MEKLFIASNNKNKIKEIKDILLSNNIELQLLCPADFNCHEEPDENGTTFEENAYIKAKYYFDKFNLPTIADDSGICIDYLDGKPGIHSARYLPELNYPQKCEYIVNLLKDVKDNRGIQFVDVICFIDKNQNVKYYRGENKGLVANEPRGSEGFGYDPIFLVPEFNKTEAELGYVYKNEHSHRAKAIKEWIKNEKNNLQ